MARVDNTVALSARAFCRTIPHPDAPDKQSTIDVDVMLSGKGL